MEPAVDDNDKKLLTKLLAEWEAANKQFETVEAQHNDYAKKLADLNKVQHASQKSVKEERSNLRQFRDKLRKLNLSKLNNDDNAKYQDFITDIAERKNRLDDMTEHLPRENNGLYLNIILGSINVSILNKNDKFRYKDEYEKFKITITIITIVFSFLTYIFHFRVLDAAFHFLLVWYYCTLTIRESILRCNGSRIKGWWVFHHYASAVLCGILLTWPDGQCYQAFRQQFVIFSFYIGVVQLLQCQYQRGCLYRLRSLGMRHSMDITVDGFHTWMFRGLTFLLPFLLFGYLYQIYNAYTLVNIFRRYSCREWQVIACAILFLILAVGNTVTTAQACLAKLNEKSAAGHRQRLTTKYQAENGNEEEDGEKPKHA